jgi:hypothetical protein
VSFPLSVACQWALPTTSTTTAPNAIGSIVQEIGFARNSTTLVVFIDPDYTTL